MFDTINADTRSRLKTYMEAALRIRQDIADLQEGLKESTKSMAEEIGTKPSVLNNAVRIEFKALRDEVRVINDEIDEILELAGRS